MSVNKELMSIPDLANQIVAVLLRIRKEHVAFMADIKSTLYKVFGISTPKKSSLLYVTEKKEIFQRKLLTIKYALIYLVLLDPQVAQILH